MHTHTRTHTHTHTHTQTNTHTHTHAHAHTRTHSMQCPLCGCAFLRMGVYAQMYMHMHTNLTTLAACHPSRASGAPGWQAPGQRAEVSPQTGRLRRRLRGNSDCLYPPSRARAGRSRARRSLQRAALGEADQRQASPHSSRAWCPAAGTGAAAAITTIVTRTLRLWQCCTHPSRCSTCIP